MPAAQALAQRFWAKVRKTETCWLWTAYCDKDGYGRLAIQGRDGLSIYTRSDGKQTQVGAHRVSWEIHRGPTGNQLVLHTCHNPPCVNPDHLYLGSPMDNAIDRDDAGHTERGEARKLSKLTKEDVLFIRNNYGKRGNGGMTLQQLADQFGVNVGLVHRIIQRKAWTHV